jgi:CubicO group peptidase (beta-lactamase class C family)
MAACLIGRFRRTAFLALLLLLAATVGARADRTDDFIAAEMKRQNIPGLSLAVIKDGQIIKAGGYGFANFKLKTAPSAMSITTISGTRTIGLRYDRAA